MLDLGKSFLASAARDGSSLAIIDGTTRLSYQDWEPRVLSVAHSLVSIGLRPGDRIVTALQNSWETATLYWACQLAGMVVVPVNWRASARELSFFVSDSEGSALVFDTASQEAALAMTLCPSVLLISLTDDLPPRALSFYEFLDAKPVAFAPRAAFHGISVMLYTSGTTAKPKGVPRTHQAERAAGIAHIAQNLYRRGDRTLGVMPLYHTMGLRSLIAMSLIGGTFVCMRRFSPADALALIEGERISTLFLIPTLYHDLLTQYTAGGHHALSSVRILTFAGASLYPGTVERLDRMFQPDLFVNQYGSTEIFTITVESNARRKPGSAGKAGINQSVRVIPLGTSSTMLSAAPYQEGQIVALLDGDEAFHGYWKRPDADHKALRGGWFFTGDCGYFDNEGDLYVTGRIDDLIISGGENISPLELENCLSQHPFVSEVAVIGLPDTRWGQVVTAVIVPNQHIDSTALAAFCREAGIAGYKIPKRFVLVDALPRSPLGKVLKRALMQRMSCVEVPTAR
jgi:2-furoate---CoA ligase